MLSLCQTTSMGEDPVSEHWNTAGLPTYKIIGSGFDTNIGGYISMESRWNIQKTNFTKWKKHEKQPTCAILNLVRDVDESRRMFYPHNVVPNDTTEINHMAAHGLRVKQCKHVYNSLSLEHTYVKRVLVKRYQRSHLPVTMREAVQLAVP